MTIQVSVLIWAVICFAATALVLDRLLFRPMLRVMDARQEKIDRAKELRRSAQEERERVLREREERHIAEAEAAEKEAERLLEEERRAALEAVTAKKEAAKTRLKEEKASLAEESERLYAALSPRADAIAAAFTQSLSGQ